MSILTISPEVGFPNKLKNQILDLPLEEGQVVIHINFHSCSSHCLSLNACSIVVNTNIFLLPNNSLTPTVLVHAVNVKISASILIKKEVTCFSLIFNALPKSATTFDFIEPGVGGWRLLNIKRNKTDVYVLRIHKKEISIVS